MSFLTSVNSASTTSSAAWPASAGPPAPASPPCPAAADLPALHREHIELTDAVARGDVAGFREMIEGHLHTGHDAYSVVSE